MMMSEIKPGTGMARILALLAMIAGALIHGPVAANETHKKPKRSELSAQVTCAKKDKSEIKLRAMAGALRGWLVRASDGEKLIAQDLSRIEILSVDKASGSVKVKLTFVKGDKTIPEEVRAKSLAGVDENGQDRQVALTECEAMTIAADTPPRLRGAGSSEAKK
jgi:hypothetical protein